MEPAPALLVPNSSDLEITATKLNLVVRYFFFAQ